MENVTGHILKADNVRLEGRLRLDVLQAGQSLPEGKNILSAASQVHIVQSHPEFAVIEITCSCGAKTYLKCGYAAGGSAVPDQVSDQTK